MYASTFAHLNNDHQAPAAHSVAPVRRKPRRRGSAALPAWRNRLTLSRSGV